MKDSEKSRKILITGGSGFVGRAVISGLLNENCEMVATFYGQEPKDLDHENLQWVQWDAGNKSLPDVDWQEIDTILHLAVLSQNLWNFPDNAQALYKVTVDAVFYLLEKAVDQNIRRVVLASTGDTIDRGIECVSEEDCAFKPVSFYGATKACAELITNAYASTISTAVLRYFHPYGDGGDRFLINRLILAVKNGKEVSIEGPQGIMINPVYSADFAQGTIQALQSNETGVFHLAGPDTISLKAFLEKAGELANVKPKIKHLSKEPPGGHSGDYKRAKELLGFEPKVTIEQGIKNVLGNK